MLSARAGEESRIEGMEAEVDDYLTKPFSARELLARVAAHVQMARMRREAEQTLRASETALRRALAEREALLKELHHRVKNNLQVITSLLEMQAASADHPQALSSLAEARNRVGAIASMHKLLYQSDSFSEVDLSLYARRLVAHVVAFYQKDSRVIVSVIGDRINIDLTRAIPLGLLLSELVSNACKHAFPGATEGRLDIGLSEADRGIHVRVHDTGIGFPAGWDHRTSTTFAGGNPVDDVVRHLCQAPSKVRGDDALVLDDQDPREPVPGLARGATPRAPPAWPRCPIRGARSRGPRWRARRGTRRPPDPGRWRRRRAS